MFGSDDEVLEHLEQSHEPEDEERRRREEQRRQAAAVPALRAAADPSTSRPPNQVPDPPPDLVPMDFVCLVPGCKFESSDRTEVGRHVAAHHPKCEPCGQRFLDAGELAEHERTDHPVVKEPGEDERPTDGPGEEEVEMAKFPCKDCPDREPFETQKGLRRHRTVVHGVTPATRKLTGRRKPGGRKKTTSRRPRRSTTRAQSDGQLEHHELARMQKIVHEFSEMSPEGRRFLMKILEEAIQ